MASPQKQNGHIQVATEFYDALCRTRIPGQSRQVLDVIIRKTWGWNKKEDVISLSQFAEATGMLKQRVIEARADLEKMNIIIVTQKRNDGTLTYGIQKDYDNWKPLRKSVTLRKSVMSVTQKRNASLRKSVPTIYTTTKDTIQKTDCEAEPRAIQPHQILVEYYKKIIGVDQIPGWDKANFSRFAKYASSLIEMLGSVDEAKKAIDWINAEASGKYTWHLGTLVKNINLYKKGPDDGLTPEIRECLKRNKEINAKLASDYRPR